MKELIEQLNTKIMEILMSCFLQNFLMILVVLLVIAIYLTSLCVWLWWATEKKSYPAWLSVTGAVIWFIGLIAIICWANCSGLLDKI